jgi:GDP-L-fucose synthase
MISDMTTLVTGSNGLLGSALRKTAASDTFFATREDGDLTDFLQTRELIESVKPTRIIHLAALVGGIGGNLIHSGDYFRNNLLINANVIEAARLAKVDRLISFMSTCVFPNEGPYPLNPANLHSGPPHPSNFGYAYAKRMLEVQSRAYREQWGLDYSVAIPTNIYGPHDNWDLTEGHVVPALIHKCFLAKQSNTPLHIWGTGKPLREFIFADDVAKLIIWMLESYWEPTPLILSPGIETSISSLVHTVVEAMGFEGEVIFDITKPDGQFRKPSDTTALKALVSDFEFTPVSKGIESTVAWFLENYPNIRL